MIKQARRVNKDIARIAEIMATIRESDDYLDIRQVYSGNPTDHRLSEGNTRKAYPRGRGKW